ncbi:MAG: M48 family metallopeptidase [Candidatus Nomurabacteria bacterium]|nr:MAG: M48 family metallopeptidase [Candidatus Nomurabacteria bacterium]HRV76339.1 SprT family zinc-dependent metalloprotease [Candidatus Saccharimonadales bacterium]
MNDPGSPFSQSFEIEGIGMIKIKRRKGQKSTTLRLNKTGGVIVSTNYSTPLYSLRRFVIDNKLWLDEAKQKSGITQDVEIFDGQLLIPGLIFKIEHQPGLADIEFKYRKNQNYITLKTPFLTTSLKLNEEKRDQLEVLVVKALREKAQGYLPNRLAYISNEMQTQYNSVTIRNTSGRWGSCSSRNDINLSLWLMILPSKLIDYVIVHELAHTRHKNHKKEFWQEVEKFCPNYMMLRQKLKKHSSQVWW